MKFSETTRIFVPPTANHERITVTNAVTIRSMFQEMHTMAINKVELCESIHHAFPY